jgi:hypothetical protein
VCFLAALTPAEVSNKDSGIFMFISEQINKKTLFIRSHMANRNENQSYTFVCFSFLLGMVTIQNIAT